MNQGYKKAFLLGIGGYVILFIGSLIFYKERTIFTDISYHLFSIVQGGGFAIQNFRFGALCTQLLPFLALKMQLSLQVVAIIYSISFTLFYFACYLFIGIKLKNYRIALSLLVFNILFVSHTFYWIQSELPQAIAIMMIVWAIVCDKNINQQGPVSLAMIFVGLFAVAFTHPLAIFPFLYVIAFFYLDKSVFIEKKTLVTVLLFYIIMLVLKNVVFKTQYEREAMGGVKNLFTYFPHYFKLYSNKRFLQNCSSKYYWIPVLSLLIAVVYAARKEYKKIFLFLLSMGCYLLLINVSYPDANTTVFYIENLYLPVGIFIAFPFIYDIMPLLQNRKLTVAAMIVIIATGCIRVYTTHTIYTTRLNWERNFLNKNADKKLLVDAKRVPMDTLLMAWGTPYEFWLLSTIENKRTASVIINDNAAQLSWGLNDKSKFLTTWGSFDYSSLPSRYFILNDTATTYTLVK